MTTANRPLVIAPMLALAAFFHLTAQEAFAPFDREGLAQLRESAQALARELECLQDEIVAEVSSRKERSLYGKADAALSELSRFQKALQPGADREDLNKKFNALDRDIHEFLKALRALESKHPALIRCANRVRFADEHLHYAMYGSAAAPDRIAEVTERQSRALANSARQLEQTADYVLGEVQGRGIFLAKLNKFTEACRHFHKGVAGRAERKELQRDYQVVNQAWEQVTTALRNLKPAEHVHLIRLAERVDVLHDRLFRLMGLEGDRSRLIIRT